MIGCPCLSGVDMADDLYKIGSVAGRTGISVERLRAWERRYGLEPAHRDGQTRFYSESQVQRLTAIKTLLDRGDAIRRVVDLDDAELQRRVREDGGTEQVLRVGLVGAPLVLLQRRAQETDVAVVGGWPGVASFLEEREVLPDMDRLVLFQASLDAEAIGEMSRVVSGIPLLTACRFATRDELERCASEGRPVIELHPGLPWAEVEDACLRAVSSDVQDRTRRFDDEELLHIATTGPASSSMLATPVAELLGELNHLVEHANRCGEEGADETAVGLSSARAAIESALAELVERHGLMRTLN